MSLINFEIELDLLWSRYCAISEITRTSAVPANPSVPAAEKTKTTSSVFQINTANLYVPVVTLSTNDNIKFVENRKQGFKRTTSWNKYRSETTIQ